MFINNIYIIVHLINNLIFKQGTKKIVNFRILYFIFVSSLCSYSIFNYFVLFKYILFKVNEY